MYAVVGYGHQGAEDSIKEFQGATPLEAEEMYYEMVKFVSAIPRVRKDYVTFWEDDPNDFWPQFLGRYAEIIMKELDGQKPVIQRNKVENLWHETSDEHESRIRKVYNSLDM